MDERRLLGLFIGFGLCCLLAAHPVLFPRTDVYILFTVLTSILWLGLLIRRRMEWRQFTFPGEIGWPVAGVVASVLLSLVMNPGSHWGGTWLLGSQLFFLWIGWWMGRETEALPLLVGVLLFGATITGLYAGLQYWHLDLLPPGTPFGYRRIVSVFANPNHLGDFLAAILPLGLTVFLVADSGGTGQGGRSAFCPRFFIYMAIGSIYAGLLLSASRGAWGAALVGSALVFTGYAREVAGKRLALRPLRVTGLVLLLLGITIVLMRRPVVTEAERTVSVSERAFSSRYIVEPYVALKSPRGAGKDSLVVYDEAINHRYFIWQVTWRMIRDSPVWGLGYGNYRTRFTAFREGEQGDERFKALNWVARSEETPYAHNEYLHVWAECGTVGLIAFLALIGTGLRLVWRGIRGNGKEALPLWGGLGAVVVVLVHSMVSYPLRLPLNGMFFWILFGVVLNIALQEQKNAEKKQDVMD